MATHIEILESLLEQLNRFDAQVGSLLRSNRKQIVATTEQIARSYAQIESSDERTRRLLRDNRSLLGGASRE